MYDVIVVGARCAGSPLAMLLARRGHRVLVVDRASFPSDTVSTHYIHQAGLSRLQDWGLLDKVVATKAPAVRELHFSYRGVGLSGFAEPIDGIDAVYCPRRTVLDEILVNAARRAGAEVVEGFTVSDLVFSEGRVAGVRGREGGNGEREFRARVVVGADGTRSTVARKTGARSYKVHPAAGVNYYAYYSGLDWGAHHLTGVDEQWLGTWPTNDGLTLLAVISGRRHLKRFRQDIAANFQAVVDDVAPKMGEQLREQGARETDFQVLRYADNYYRHPYGPGWALVGDAGYHKDPYTGFGITDAFRHAELLAERLHQGLCGERQMADALAEYHKLRDESSADHYALTTTLSELTELPPLFQSVLGAMANSQKGADRLFGLLGGGLEHRDIFSPDALRRLYDDAGVPEDQRVYR
ncbi:NAD(P)/FAD-dependent oxidoreductase [Streptomyces ipomoeae]|uniref:NAD(P)/FAD-dependent oxidoreductase n=1 Tax=Streptomyces ipomoeae TaxID=103232 RepID=UPI001146528E|nr:NAD(P)/FAD-dependent oxidoreductase [Streptomyces ipomoeae]MDX2933909.1 NAD(P)/FAD-dependent oxidoreductase [Streptomyces ipomoeae]TQE28832.1 NAD(P)/FAD-dependent oxidoreductase [Streptomyces ipomoeae]